MHWRQFLYGIVVLLFILGGQTGPSRAQSYYFRNYQVNDGLSSNTITCILQDKKGFIWLGTRNGLNQFDGTHFKIFRQQTNNSSNIGNSSILCLLEDRCQRLWIGTYKGIYLYNSRTERFSTIPGLPMGEVRAIKSDNQSNMWMIINHRLYHYSPATGHLKFFPADNAQTTLLQITPSGQVWTASDNGILKKYDTLQQRFIRYRLPLLYPKEPVTALQDIFVLNDTAVMIGTMNRLLVLNTATLKMRNIFRNNNNIPDIQIHQILRKDGQEFWLGTEKGLYIYNYTTGKSHLFTKQVNNPYALTDNVIYSFCKDREGGIWVGTFFGGVNYYSPQLSYFRKYFPQSAEDPLSGSLVHEITQDKYGNTWIGTEDGGLNKIEYATGKIRHFLPGKGKGKIAYNNIHGLVAMDKELWIGTYEHGLDVMDIPSGKVIRHYNQGNKPGDLNGNFIVSLARGIHNELYIGTWSGLLVYNRAGNNFRSIPFFNKQVQAIHQDEEGTIWVASYGNGVFYYNPYNGKHGRILADQDNPNSLPNNYVNNLFEDSHKNIWFCTESGLARLNRQTNRLNRYTLKEGFPNDQVFKILEDDRHRLWISTSHGLICYNPLNQTHQLYTTAYGLPSDLFNYNSGFKSANGTLYFGTVKGMISFDPATMTSTRYGAPVYITGLQINNQNVPMGEKQSPLHQSLIYTSKITLPYNQSDLAFEVAVLSYAIPEANTFSYRMEGLDKEWIPVDGNRKIFYTKLPPGNYTFRVKGAGSSKNHNEASLQIQIKPPYWASIWAYLFYFLFSGSILFLILRYYFMAGKEKHQRMLSAFELAKEREVYRAKIDFFTQVAHEIRTPLTLIKLPLEKILKTGVQSNLLKENLEIMNNNTTRLIDLTNQLLDFRKAEATNYSLNFTLVDISAMLRDIYKNFKPSADAKNLSLELQLPRISLQAYVDEEAMHKILINLLTNAIKYAGSKIFVRLKPFNSEDTTFYIEVKNDGYLIPYDQKEKIFKPFTRLKATEKQTGTGIGLPLSRALAELHKGVLDLQQPEDDMNVFLLSMPIEQKNSIQLKAAPTEEKEKNIFEETRNYKPNRAQLLVVEDNREILDFLAKELSLQYNIYTASNGEEALALIRTENIELLITDIMMPVMDGFALCKNLKSDIQYSHIPIIMLTAKTSLNARITGLETGADAYIEKPFSMEHLQAQIENLLNNRRIIQQHFAHSPLAHIRGMGASRADKNFLEQLQQLIIDNITNENFDVDSLAAMVNMSRPTFYRKIKALSNLTPNDLIHITRLKKAAELLSGGNYRINEIASMMGYSIAGNFSRDFNKQFGLSPMQYLEQLKKEKKDPS